MVSQLPFGVAFNVLKAERRRERVRPETIVDVPSEGIGLDAGIWVRRALAALDPGEHGRRSSVATRSGFRQAYESLVGVTLTTLEVAPVLLLWAAVLWFPARAFLRTAGVRRRGH